MVPDYTLGGESFHDRESLEDSDSAVSALIAERDWPQSWKQMDSLSQSTSSQPFNPNDCSIQMVAATINCCESNGIAEI